ncbi:MAG: hypothetical protein ACFE8N_11090 [Promethearchaeota archaeon]
MSRNMVAVISLILVIDRIGIEVCSYNTSPVCLASCSNNSEIPK